LGKFWRKKGKRRAMEERKRIFKKKKEEL